MNIQDLVTESLHLPTNAIAYVVSHSLARTEPGAALLEGDDMAFDLAEFARDGHCRALPRSDVHIQIETDWRGKENDLGRTALNGWLEVDWQGHQIDVLLMRWNDGRCGERRYHWILAESMEIAEAFYCAVCDWCTEVRGEILVFEGGYWGKSRELYRSVQSTALEQVVLPQALKQEIVDDFSRFFGAKPTYEQYGIPWKRGILFIGPPGNGKTYTVKALLNRLKQPCLYVKSFKAEYATDHDSIREVFKRARQTTPCILVLEDLDSLVDSKNRSFFLNELDGFAANTGILVLATTNHPERLDPAILERPSRFDRKYYFEIPGPAEREAYLRMWNGALQDDLKLADPGVAPLVEQTDGFSYAYLKELFLSSMMKWIASPEKGAMESLMLAQVNLLREQMRSGQRTEGELSDFAVDDEDESAVGFAGFVREATRSAPRSSMMPPHE